MQKQPLSSHYPFKTRRAFPKRYPPPSPQSPHKISRYFRRTTEFLLVRALAYYETVEFYENETRELSQIRRSVARDRVEADDEQPFVAKISPCPADNLNGKKNYWKKELKTSDRIVSCSLIWKFVSCQSEKRNAIAL